MLPTTRATTSAYRGSCLVWKRWLISCSARKSIPVNFLNSQNSSSTRRLRNFKQAVKSATWWPREPFNTPEFYSPRTLAQITLLNNVIWLTERNSLTRSKMAVQESTWLRTLEPRAPKIPRKIDRPKLTWHENINILVMQTTSTKHWWFSGRILACHAGGPGSIPGQCRLHNLLLGWHQFATKRTFWLVLLIVNWILRRCIWENVFFQ